MAALPKMKDGVQQKKYYEDCEYYADPMELLELLPEAAKKAALEAAEKIKKANNNAVIPAKKFRYNTILVGVKGTAGFCIPAPSKKDTKSALSPEVQKQIKTVIMETLGGDTVAVYAKDIWIAKWLIFSSVGVAFVIAVLYLVLLQLIGGAMIWLSFALALVGTGGGGLYAY